MKRNVKHVYYINTQTLSPWGKAQAIFDALTPLKGLPSMNYGFEEESNMQRIKIWWRTDEDL